MKKPPGKAQQKRIANAAAKKQRRQKVMAFGGLGVLGILMFIQGPKLLNAFGGQDTSTSAAGAGTPSASVPDRGRRTRALRLLNATVDPFAARSLGDNDPQALAVSGPGGISDPFAQGAVSTAPPPAATPVTAPLPLPTQIVVGTRKPGAIAKRGWIVVLASVETRVGRAYAESFAARARRAGVGSTSVLVSSTRKPLRAGYYVVYTGPFSNLSAVQRSAAHVHALGYRTAYVREILRY